MRAVHAAQRFDSRLEVAVVPHALEIGIYVHPFLRHSDAWETVAVVPCSAEALILQLRRSR